MGHVELGVIFVNGLVQILVHVGEDGARQTIGDGGDIVPAGAIGLQSLAGIVQDLLRLGVRAVNGGPQAAHEHQLAVEVLLKGGDVVLRQGALPHLNADLRHVVHNGHQIGVGVVDGDDAPGADIAIEAAIGLLEEVPPHLRLHE